VDAEEFAEEADLWGIRGQELSNNSIGALKVGAVD
jgi:hypothetical protein